MEKNLSIGQRVAMYAKGPLIELEAIKAKKRKLGGITIDPGEEGEKGRVREIVAKALGVGEKSIDCFKCIQENAPHLIPEIIAGEMSLQKASHIAKGREIKLITYFIKCNEFTKIGITDNIFSRLKALQIGNPYQLEVVKTLIGNHERKLHKKFEDKQVVINGLVTEWFRLSDNDINDV